MCSSDLAERMRWRSAASFRVRRVWDGVRIEVVEEGPAPSVSVASSVHVTARIHLGDLSPDDVAVELYAGRVDVRGDIVAPCTVPMHSEGGAHGDFRYAGEIALKQSGRHGYTIRVRPNHPDLGSPFVPGLIRWADHAQVEAAVAR